MICHFSQGHKLLPSLSHVYRTRGAEPPHRPLLYVVMFHFIFTFVLRVLLRRLFPVVLYYSSLIEVTFVNVISNSFIHFLSLVTKTTTHDTNKAHIAAGYCMTFISDKCDNINIYAKSNMVLETQQMDFCIIEFTCHDCLNLFFELSSCQRSVGWGV